MIRRLVLAAVFGVAAASAYANSYSDVWYDVNEPGWGVFIKQSNTFQFLAFHVYGVDGQPTWFTAQLFDIGDGLNYYGPLYASTGTYFVNPWQGSMTTQVGMATFSGSPAPGDYFHALLAYTVGDVSVTRTIQRQTLTAYALSGSYSGALVGRVSGCANPANNNAGVNGRFNLTVAQVADTSATLTFTFVDPNTNFNGMVCTLGGPLTHYGGLYTIQGAQYSCSAPGFSPDSIVAANVDLLDQTGQGVEGKWSATTSTGCSQSLRFTAVSN